MKPKIAVIGAGSTVFMKNIVGDVLHLPAFRDATIALFDIDSTRLEESTLVAEKLGRGTGSHPTILPTLDRREALRDAHFVVFMFQVGGYQPATVIDFEIPRRFGLQQTIGDTLGIGGIMRAARSIPVFDSIFSEIRELCPSATVLNYVNPMAMLSWHALATYPEIRYVGLCHSVQETAALIGRELGIPYEQLVYRSAGINHVSFLLELWHRKDGVRVDLYPRLLKLYQEGKAPTEKGGSERCDNIVRFELLKRFGHFVTESSEHFAEYTPWFIKQGKPGEIARYRIPLDEYPKRCVEQIADWQRELASFREASEIRVDHSNEYAARIMNSIWTNEPSVIYGNVRNGRLLENLPEDCCVELPCLVDGNGIQPVRVGRIAPHLAGLMSACVSVQACVVEAFRLRKRELIHQAAMLDPHTAAELTLDEIRQLVDELLAAHSAHGYLPDFLVKG